MSLIINKVKRYISKFEKIHSNFQTDNFSTTDISKKIFDKFGFSESTPLIMNKLNPGFSVV